MSPSIDKLFQSYHSAVFSPCGNYLAISDRTGTIFVHKISSLTSKNSAANALENVAKVRPLVTIPSDASSATIVKLLGWKNFLLCCFPDGQVNAYSWSDISKQRTVSSWAKRFITSQGHVSSIGYDLETWATSTDQSGRELLLAGGTAVGSDQDDCPVLCWDVESSKLLNSFRGHKKSVHTITTIKQTESTEFLSAGESGEVLLWDLRTPTNSAATMKPFETECARSEFGRWIGCLVADGEWMVCGGGPRLGLWHIGSRSLVQPMTANGSEAAEHNCGVIADERIITAGSGGSLFHWNYRGSSIAVMPATCNFIYDLQYASKPNQKTVAAVGSGRLIDLYSNLIYRMTPLETIA